MNLKKEYIMEVLNDWDHRVHEKFTNHRISYMDSFFSAFTGLGSMYVISFFLAATFLVRPNLFDFIMPGLILLVASVYSMKKYFGRPKPEESPLTVDMTASFPSGHSAVSVYTAVGFSQIIPEIAVLLYSVASIVCISRVYLGAHYPSDVVAGAFMGAVFALLI